MTFGKRLTLSFFALSLAMMAMGGLSYFALRRLGNLVGTTARVASERLQLVSEIRETLIGLERDSMRTQHSYVIQSAGKLYEEHEALQAKLRAGRSKARNAANDARAGKTAKTDFSGCTACHAVEDAGKVWEKLAGKAEALGKRIGQAKPLMNTAEERAALEGVDRALAAWSELYRQYLDMAGGGRFADSHTILVEKILPLEAAGEAEASRLNQVQQQSFAAAQKSSIETADSNARTMLAIVTGGMLLVAAVLWMMENPARGVCLPDDLPHDFILNISKPYLGKFISTPSDWTPLKGYKSVFEEYAPTGLDHSDPWQFKNFRVV